MKKTIYSPLLILTLGTGHAGGKSLIKLMLTKINICEPTSEYILFLESENHILLKRNKSKELSVR